MDETIDMMGGDTGMGGIGSMVPPEQAAAMAAFQNTDRNTLMRDLNSAVNDVAPGAVQSIVAELRTMGFDAEDVDNWVEILDEMLQDPAEYVTSREQLIAQGMDPEFLPEMYDYEYLVGLRMAFEALRDEVAMMPAMPVQNFAEGGIAELRPIAQAMSQMGRNGDTMLAHITPQEAMMLRQMGGSGTINPYTGLPEFFLKKVFKAAKRAVKSVGKAVGSVVKSVGNAVKNFVKSDIGRIVATVGLTMLAGPAAAAILGSTAPAWAVTGLAAGMGGAGAALLAGENIGNALKAGLTSAVTAGAGSAVLQGVNAPYTGAKTYGELFGTSPAGAAPSPRIGNDAFVQGGYDLETGAVLTPEGVSATRGITTPGTVSATAPMPKVDYSLTGGTAVPSSDTAIRANLSSSAPLTGADQYQALDPRLTNVRLSPASPVPTTSPTASASFYDRAVDTLGRGYEGIKDIYSEYISPNRGMPTSADISSRAGQIIGEAQAAGSSISYKDAMDLASKQLSSQAPGMIARYAPIAGIGLGAAYLGGAFTPEPPPEPSLTTGPSGIDLYQANPEQYRPNIYAGQTPVSYQDLNPMYYQQQQYAAYNPFMYNPRSSVAPASSLAQESNYYGSYATPQRPVYRKDGGITETSKFKRKVGAISGPGTEKSDDIPAMLSDGEFVFTARAVRGMGNGSRRKGAKAMYRLMKMLEKKAGGAV